MKKCHVKNEKGFYFCSTGLGKPDYFSVLSDLSLFDEEIMSVIIDIKKTNDVIEISNIIECRLDSFKKLCDIFLSRFQIEIVDSYKNNLDLSLFMLISVSDSPVRMFRLKSQLIKALNEIDFEIVKHSTNKQENISQNLILEPNEDLNSSGQVNISINDSQIEVLEELIHKKRVEKEEISRNIEALYNTSKMEMISENVGVIEADLLLANNEKGLLSVLQNSIIEKISFAKGEEKRKLYEENKELTSNINALNEKINSLELRMANAKKYQLQDDFKSQILRLEVVLDNINQDIKELENEIKTVVTNESKIAHSNTSDELTYKKALRQYQSKVTFYSQYVDLGYNFSITNISFYSNSLSEFSSFYAVIFNMLTRGKHIKPSKAIQSMGQEELYKVYQIQIAFLMLIRTGKLMDDVWHINIEDSLKPLASIAYTEITSMMAHLIDLTNVKYAKPSLVFDQSEGINIVFDTYVNDPNTYAINMTNDNYSFAPVWIEDRIKYTINPSNKRHIDHLTYIMNYLFGFDTFKDGQVPIIANFLSNKNTLGILTTGGGKSLTYYLSVLMQPKISLVVAPINSLIKDQTDKLRNSFSIDRYAILTGDNANKNEDLNRFKNAQTLFTFASPERAQNKRFRDILINLSYNHSIGSIILDEVHCLSEWGHDFRIPYLMLATTLNTYCEGIRYLGLTATASINVVKDLMVELSILEKDVIYSKKLKRENLNFTVHNYIDSTNAIEALKRLLINNYQKGTLLDIDKHNKQVHSSIVFSRTVNGPTGVERIYSELTPLFPGHIGLFHGDRKDEQDSFMNDDVTLLVATKAFGMGIDKSNIRMTLHFGMPESREAYYQEAGRAGRDNEEAMCMLFSYIPEEKHREIERFLDPNTKYSELQNILGKLRGTDIATNFFFYLQNVAEPQIEVEKTMTLYEKLKAHNDYIVNIQSGEKKEIEKYLYILHKMGIVKNWDVIYRSLDLVDITVDLNSKYDDIRHIKDSSLYYIHSYSQSNQRKKVEIEQDDIYRMQIEEIVSIKELSKVVSTIRHWYQHTFVQTRKEKLKNMYNLVKDTSNHEQIQDILEKAFDISETIGKTAEGYSLNFDVNTISEVIKFALELDENKLTDRRIALEHLLESTTSTKISLHMAFIQFRSDSPKENDNGKSRLISVLNVLNESEKNDFYDAIINHYHLMNQGQKLSLFNVIDEIDDNQLLRLIDKLETDEASYIVMSDYILKRMEESW